jgi:hypothetical protein
MQKTKFRKLLSEEIIVNSPYPEVIAPAVSYTGDRGGDHLTFDWNCITQPLTITDAPRCPERDQFILFAGTNLDNLEEFGAEIELALGSEGTKQVITEPKLVYIPAGLTYGPLVFKKVTAPTVYVNFFIAPQFSKKWEGGDYVKLLATPVYRTGVYETKTFVDGMAFREGSIPTHMMLVLGDDIGPEGANFCLFYYAIRHAHLLTEPTHSHEMDMWIINLGGNPLDVEEFDAEIEMFWGEEGQKLVLDSASVAHIPAGLLHRSMFFSPVNKPFVQIHTYTRKFCDKDVVIEEETSMNIAPGMNN